MGVKNRLRKIRHEMMIDHAKEMASILGISEQAYSRLENQRNQPTLEKALIYAQKLNRTVDEIFYLASDE
ncbi:MAG: helix-turn-helix domain-containing protein [Desulfosporosinus sp.]|nr:helix-turn-helix domain-containing protein [Desulfosporosinus sp.]